MLPNDQATPILTAARRAILRVAAHWDAFRGTPSAYLLATWWRVRGKRVRSRHHFARLLGGTRWAYDLWMIRRERPPSLETRDEGAPNIVALVMAATATPAALARTLNSLSEERLVALPIGTAEVPTGAEAARRIDWNEPTWLMPIFAGDTLAPGAGNAYRSALGQSSAAVAYADDDLLDPRGRRTAPHFKPGWNEELFRHFDYLTGACILRTTSEELEATTDVNWARAIITDRARIEAPLHIPKVLHHRIARPAPRVAAIRGGDTLPAVSIIIPTRNRYDLLKTCCDGIEATAYSDLEVIIVDNGSDDPDTLAFLDNLSPSRYRVLRHPGPFNYSAINNRAAAEAKGELLCLLNNDIEVIEPNWLAVMARQALRANVGAVGAQLLYPDGRIQHAGVVLGMGGAAGHAHRFLHPEDGGYFQRHAIPQFVSAVTAACLVVARDRFMAVEGLDDQNFAVAFNDVDLCLRLNQRGWQALYEPRARLIHHESVSRGFDQDVVGAARFAAELKALKRLWSTDEDARDPYHHPELSRASEHFVVRL